ncbi:MAG: Phosphate transport system permease protein PstA [Planctomycetota bacterium]
MSSERPRQRRLRSGHTALAAHGEPWVWLTAGSLALALAMIGGLLALIVARGAATFWPVPLELVETTDGGRFLAEVVEREPARPATAEADGQAGRLLLRTAAFEETGNHFAWVDEPEIASVTTPPWATVVERLEAGRLHGTPVRLLHGDEVVAAGAEDVWAAYEREHPAARRRWWQAMRLDRVDRGRLQRQLRTARLAVVAARLDAGEGSAAEQAAAASEQRVQAEVEEASRDLDARTAALRAENAGWVVEFETAAGGTAAVPLDGIVRAWQPNRLGWSGKLGVYASRWGEFLADDPREANSAGGVFPAIWGTVVMTLIMALLVAPFGVLAALYLREYASSGPITSAVRVAINNLAGVPSIVYGAFGLGFFCYGIGAGIDDLFFKPSLVADSQPVFGTGGLLWASLTLALLTLPVVIVATEEALSAVPNSMREGSYACGAGKWQTIRRIVLPRALPGIMTGLILAMARGAGEVAPLMLVGVKKLALDLPVDGTFPFIHPEREFMHLAYLIYDVGFQSPNSQAAQPMVFTITFLLVGIIAVLNLAAIWIRSRLRRRYVAQQF